MAFFLLVLNFLLVPTGPLFFIVQSLSPGLGWCHLCSIRAWQNNGERWEGALTGSVLEWQIGVTGAGFAPFLGRNLNISSQPFCGNLQLAKDFCANSPGFTSVWWWRFFPSVWQFWMMCNNFSDHDLIGELGLSENWLKIWVLEKFLQSCYHVRCDMGFVLCVSEHWPFSFCHFTPLVCHLASRDFIIMKVLILLQ